MSRASVFFTKFPLEALVWFAGLLALAVYDPKHQSHFTLCPLSKLGFDFCPGCGLGRSISYFFHGEIIQSLSIHPVGIFAVIILSSRIVQLTKNHIRSHGQNH